MTPVLDHGTDELTADLADAHKGCRILIVNLTRPLESRVPKHLCTEDAATLAKEVGPEVVLLTHFGMRLVHEGIKKQAEHIERTSGCRTLPAEDLMSVQVGKAIRSTRSLGQELVEEAKGPVDLDK
jgi:ribonuclease BN (tRNA processing enzyme)